MNNCLVTKLSGNVDANNFPVYGEIVFTVAPTTISDANKQQRFSIAAATGKSITVSVKSGTGVLATSAANLVNDPKQSITVSGVVTSIYFSNAAMEIAITSKYDIEAIEFYATSGVAPALSFDLSDLSYLTKLETLKVRYVTGIGGTLEDLARLTSLNSVGFMDTHVSGTIEGFVAAQIGNGRATETTGIVWQNITRTNETFGGNHYTTVTGLLTWDSASKITIYNASTKESATTVYAKGATAGEISAWESAGKTVVVVS